MDVDAWWLALDLKYTSYSEVKARRVIAQGWPKLGDLSGLVSLAASPATKLHFQEQIAELSRQHYPDSREIDRAPKALWMFFQIQAGDLVIALEGTRICGITQATSSAVDGYWFDSTYHYGQCAGRDQTWIDWDHAAIDETPTAPRQGVLAATRIQKEKQKVLLAWERLQTRNSADVRTLPDEIPLHSVFTEGSVVKILVNRYERDPQAREICICYYGARCCVCEFVFSEKYGDFMNGYIHVHHLIPLSTIAATYEVDPINDLRPVCPNCHAAIHRREPPYSIEELKNLIKRS